MDIIKLRAVAEDGFRNGVFGGDCFVDNYPEILTTGVDTFRHTNGFYYMVKDGKPVDGVSNFINSSAFFSQEEVDEYMEQV